METDKRRVSPRQICFRRDAIPTGSVAGKVRNLMKPAKYMLYPEYKHYTCR